jgi:subtilisin family serine protease
MSRRIPILILTALMALAVAAGPVAGMRLDQGAPTPSAELSAMLGDLGARPAAEKLGGQLVEIAQQADPKQREWITVQSFEPVDFSAFSQRVHAFRWPAGEYVAVLEVAASELLDLAALPGVYAVDGGPGDPDIRPESPAAPAPLPYAALRAQLDAAPGWSEPVARPGMPGAMPAADAPDRAGEGARPDGWYDARAGHAAQEAWDLGFKGQGVTVAVLDDAVDFAHPDLQGTWRVLPAGHAYAGWPQAFDPIAGFFAAQDTQIEDADARSVRNAASGWIEMYQRSAVETRELGGEMVATACFQALAFGGNGAVRMPESCDYRVPETSKGGEIRFGHHPDAVLLGLRQPEGMSGEAPGVILVDEGAAGDFDTVYVDIDNDHDFTDEKPMTQASPLGWRDIDGDGLADYTGGLLNFISDGSLPMPGAWVWGLEEWIPEAGDMIAIQWALGGHGTLCASNIGSQGVLRLPAGRALAFRDLPGDGQPPATNLGMAPEARIVSIGSVYDIGGMFAPAWHYAVLGPDIDDDSDAIQITSNSYGFSGDDDDGWDANSRLIEHYVRMYSPETSMLFSTGNGAPGYGTLAPPSPQTGLGIAASTQMGSTGFDSITDTMQITFGDIIPFSNRGPGADGRNGPTVAADGASASGGSPINGITASGGSGALANGTWGGTSRSSPVAAGVMALTYQAFKSKEGRWPSYEEARAILMSGARYAAYDTFTMGAGIVDAADSARIAAGLGGVYAMPSEWTPGGYRGERYESFAKIMHPGDTDSGTFTLHNPSDKPIEVTVAAQTLRRIGSHDMTLTSDNSAESDAGPVPDYLQAIDKSVIPEGTELMVARGVMPLREYDINGDYAADNAFSLAVMQHTDINGDGALWEDANNNGAVNSRFLTPAAVELSWEGGGIEHNATPGGINAAIPAGEGLSAEIAWFGRGCNADAQEQEVTEKIALIERGSCTFVEKLTNALNAGAVGAVVFTDARGVVAMGGDGLVDLPAVMIARQPGLDLMAQLTAGTPVVARMFLRDIITRGLDGLDPVVFAESEIQEWEWERFSDDGSAQNSWQVTVHHPLERWADGLYLAWWHEGRSPDIAATNITTRLDFYAYEDSDYVDLSAETITIPAGGQAQFEATVSIPGDAPAGGYVGAIFVDYARGEGDAPVEGPGGYELEQQRVVIPLNVNVADSYDWKGSVVLGGEAAEDMDSPYPNGLFRGHFRWNWRPESGDWRFFFVDALSEPKDGTFWIFRSTWEDALAGQSDIDTRVYGPMDDPFSDPAHRANQDEDVSDPDWYGPYGLGLLARSPYLVAGSTWPFNTSSGGNEDWLATPAGEGLHEVMLHNVLFSGASIEMPFQTQVSSLQMTPSNIVLYGDACTDVSINSQIDLPGLTLRGFGMSVPEFVEGAPATQDDPNDPTSASFKYDIALPTQAGRFVVTIDGEDDDDLDMWLLYDGNGDGMFDFNTEQVGVSATETGDERISLPGFPQAGNYQVWVLGWQVNGADSKFDLTVDTISGDSITVEGAPGTLIAGQPASFQVCADTANLEGEDGPANGVLVMGPQASPSLIQMPVTWMREAPVYNLYLPILTLNHDLRAVEEGG